jgi:hypothetical protein
LLAQIIFLGNPVIDRISDWVTQIQYNPGWLKLMNKLEKSGTHNYLGCKIPVQSGINVQIFRKKLVDYYDNIICEFF